MFRFQKKQALNDVDASMCNPIIVNQTNQSIVLFLDRGVLYNKQVLAPGEAVGMTRSETAGKVVPYKIHAVVGGEQSLPTRRQSMKNLMSTAVIPTAFIIGTLAAASSAGTLSGPSSALSRAAGGMVVRGMVIDSAALAAGSVTANRAAFIADKLLEEKPKNFSAKSGHFMPGNRYVIVTGGIEEPLTITTIKEKQFRQIAITGDVKTPMDTLQDKMDYYTPSILRLSTKPDEKGDMAITDGSDVNESVPRIEEQREQQEQIQSESEEDRQLRQAIEESLKMQEATKQQEDQYDKRLKGEKRNPVVLF